MRTITLLCWCLLFLGAGTAQAQTNFFSAGNQAYQQGQYEKALGLYGRAAEEKGYSAPLFHNMGNCLARLNRYGPAVLAYERALLLKPTDRDARANLALVRARAGLPDPAGIWWQRAMHLLGPDQWAMGGAGLLAATVLFLLAGLRRKGPPRPHLIPAACLGLLCAAGMALMAYQGYRHWQEGVLLKDAELLVSPFASSESRGRLGAGHLIRVVKKHQEYVLIRDRDRNKGWVRTTDIARIEDLASGLAGQEKAENSRQPPDQEEGR